MSLSVCTILGRLTHDPELRHTQSNLPVANFTLAVERDVAQDGKRQADFIDIIAWRGIAEFVSKYFVKGQLVAVTGRLQTRTWTDNNGTKRKATEIVASHAYFAEAKRERSKSPQSQCGTYDSYNPLYTSEPTQNGFEDFYSYDDDDMPF